MQWTCVSRHECVHQVSQGREGVCRQRGGHDGDPVRRPSRKDREQPVSDPVVGVPLSQQDARGVNGDSLKQPRQEPEGRAGEGRAGVGIDQHERTLCITAHSRKKGRSLEARPLGQPQTDPEERSPANGVETPAENPVQEDMGLIEEVIRLRGRLLVAQELRRVSGKVEDGQIARNGIPVMKEGTGVHHQVESSAPAEVGNVL